VIRTRAILISDAEIPVLLIIFKTAEDIIYLLVRPQAENPKTPKCKGGSKNNQELLSSLNFKES